MATAQVTDREPWIEANRSAPCPKCEATKQCKVSPDGSRVACFNVEEGSVKSGEQSDGRIWYLHVLLEDGMIDGPRLGPGKATEGPSWPKADAETIDRVYNTLLDRLALSAAHRRALLERGLSDEWIDRARYRSSSSDPGRVAGELAEEFGKDVLLGVPGFYARDGVAPWIAGSGPCLLVPCRNIGGRIAAIKLRPDRPIGDAKYIYLSSAAPSKGGYGPGSPIHVPLGLSHPLEMVRLTEGELKADSASLLSLKPTIATPGVGSWRRSIPIAKALGASVVLLAFDSDSATKPPVARALADCAAGLADKGFDVHLELWAAADGKGIDDLLKAGKSPTVVSGAAAMDAIRETAERAGAAGRNGRAISFNGSHPPGPGGPELPTIVCGSEKQQEGLKTWTPLAVDALRRHNLPPRVFQQANSLVRIRGGDEDGPPSIGQLSIDAFRGELDRAAYWANEHFDKRGNPKLSYGPPRVDVVRDLMSLGRWDEDVVPRLDLIVESPHFLPDGTLLRQPGYNREARLFYAPSPGMESLVIPRRPSRAEVEASLSLLVDDLLGDFSLANQASKANAVEFMLLPFVRRMIHGPTPLHHFGATTEGTGKTLLAICCSYPWLGREIAARSQKESEAEWRKAVFVFLRSGTTHVLMDNLANPLGHDGSSRPVDSGVLASALTAFPYYEDRLLGVSEEARVKVNVCWASTGNNTWFSRELERRRVPIDLISPVENPSLRTGFRYDPIITEFLQPRRFDLLKACLTLCQHWIAAGCPRANLPFGRFESYAQTMGGILESAGVEGFLANRPLVIQRNADANRWSVLVGSWASAHGTAPVSASDLWTLVISEPDLSVAFASVLGEGKQLSQKQKLGNALRAQTGQIWGDWRVVSAGGDSHKKILLYKLKPATEAYVIDCEDAEDPGVPPSDVNGCGD